MLFTLNNCAENDDLLSEPERILTSGEWQLNKYTIDGKEYDTLFTQECVHGQIHDENCVGGYATDLMYHKCWARSRYVFNNDGTCGIFEWHPKFIWTNCNPQWNLRPAGSTPSDTILNWNFEAVSQDGKTGYLSIGSWKGLIEIKSEDEFEIIEFNGRIWRVAWAYHIIDGGYRTETYNDLPPPNDNSLNRYIEVTTTFRLR
jgi:hypothetical protein